MALPSTGSNQPRLVVKISDPVESAPRLSKDDTLVLPHSVTFFEKKVKQTFEFVYPEGTDAASVNESLSVRSALGASSYNLSFQRCLDTYGQSQSRLVFQDIELEHLLSS